MPTKLSHLTPEEYDKRTRIKMTWVHMIRRCYVEHSTQYNGYGGRGIRVCEQWRHSFENFYLDMKDLWSPETNTIDRINNDGDYSPENCRWLSKSDNSKHQRIKMLIRIRDGSRMSISLEGGTRIIRKYRTSIRVRNSEGSRLECTLS